MNHLSHGFTANSPIIPGEDSDEFDALVNGLIAEYQPAIDTEQILVEKMATHQWLSLRALRLQSHVFKVQVLKDRDFTISKNLGLLIRYHTSSDRAFLRMHTELVKAQKERKKSEIGWSREGARYRFDPFLLPAHQTGLADLQHPASRRTSRSAHAESFIPFAAA